LGVPDSTASNASAGTSFAYSADCVSPASFLTSVNNSASSSLTSLDGVIVNSLLLNTSRLAPCFLTGGTPPTVTVGGVAGVVTYAGWVPDSVAGLYQVNVRLPGSGGGPFTNSAGASVAAITTPVQLPVVVTVGSSTSQAGVNMWVARRLKVAGPSGGGLTGTVNVAWAGSNNSVLATQGTSPYSYALTSGVLPTGLTLNATTGAISGTPLAGTAGSYAVTVTATDSANFPLTGKVAFTVTVAGGLVVSTSTASPIAATYGTAAPSATTISASGGAYPYTFAIASAPLGMTINTNTGVIGVSALTPAGTYNLQITATDSATSPLTGTLNISIVVGLNMANTTLATLTQGVGGALTTVSATGNTGAVSFALDNTTPPPAGVTVNSSTGVVSVSSAVASGTYTVIVNATDAGTAAGAAAVATGARSITFTL
jgi:hypothetical protein